MFLVPFFSIVSIVRMVIFLACRLGLSFGTQFSKNQASLVDLPWHPMTGYIFGVVCHSSSLCSPYYAILKNPINGQGNA